jgi:hypothetical protein
LSAAVIQTLPISATGAKAEVLAKSIQQAVLRAVPSITPKQAEVAFAKAQSSMQPHETVYLPIGSLANAVAKTRGEVTSSSLHQIASDPSNLTVFALVSLLSVTPNTPVAAARRLPVLRLPAEPWRRRSLSKAVWKRMSARLSEAVLVWEVLTRRQSQVSVDQSIVLGVI